MRGVSRMVEEDRYCIDVLTQISAIQAALDKVALGLLDGHTRHCLIGEGLRGGLRRRADERGRPAHAARVRESEARPSIRDPASPPRYHRLIESELR